jgi:hypothetical protein
MWTAWSITLGVVQGLLLILCAAAVVALSYGRGYRGEEFWIGVGFALLIILAGIWMMRTRRRTLLNVFLALLVSVTTLVLFASRPTQAEVLVGQVPIGGTIAEAKTVLGEPIGGVDPRSMANSPAPTAYLWNIEGDLVVVFANADGIVTSASVRRTSLLQRLRKRVGLD